MPNVHLSKGRRICESDKTMRVSFGNLLNSVRTHRGMTQKDVAYKLGIKSESLVSDWERGRCMPSSLEVLFGMLDIFAMDDQEIGKLYDLGDNDMKKALRNDERVQKMLELRKEGLTNKQIAKEIGCGVSTVYENIGKRSMDVRKAAEQNKPSPVPEEKKPEPIKVEIPVVVETKPIEDKTGSKLTETDYSTANAAMAAIKANVDSWAKEPVANETSKRKLGTLSIRKEVRILELDGVACNYRVNTGTGDIELVSFDDRASLVEGLLDKSNLDAMIGELQMIRTLL